MIDLAVQGEKVSFFSNCRTETLFGSPLLGGGGGGGGGGAGEGGLYLLGVIV